MNFTMLLLSLIFVKENQHFAELRREEHILQFGVSSQSLTEGRARPIEDVKGYQEYLWGQSRKAVLNDLRKKQIEFELKDESSERKIITRGELHFENIVLPIEVKKEFSFYNDSLYLVSMQYEPESISPTDIDTVFTNFKRELTEKYGKPASDSLSEEDSFNTRFVEWSFKSSNIRLIKVYIDLSFLESSKKSIESVTVVYTSRLIFERKALKLRKTTKRQF